MSTMPDLPSRGRFSPFMFNGIMFSTGGYSAEYGQALSSVLELKTPGLFDEDITSLMLMNLGLGLSHTRRNLRSAYSFEGFYANMTPFFMMAQNDLDWIKAPESVSGNFMHRVKVGKTGMVKSSINYSYSKSKLNYPSDIYGFDQVGLTNQNLLYITTYNTELNKNWMLKSGLAFNNNKDLTDVNDIDIDERLNTVYARIGLVNFFNKNITFKFGSEVYRLNYKFGLSDSNLDEDIAMNPADLLMSGYFEGDIKLSKKIAFRLGVRSEYSNLTKKYNIAPRVSVACKVSKSSQFSMASGTFYQQANPEYLKYTDKLNYERANHYILNYQYQKGKRILRTELYYKNYDNLITYQPGEFTEFEQIENNGIGYARGLDIFWRDNKSFKNTDYWISYSFIDSKRKFKDYPTEVTPDFVTAHNVSVVYKRWFNKINSQVSLAYNFLSGRPYHSPYKSEFMSETTKNNHDISGNISYITNLFGYFTVVHLSVSNLLGLENTYSYRYTENPNQQGEYIETPIKSMTLRTIIIGVFISFK